MKIAANTIEFEGIDPADYPDFTDSYIVYAEYEDGTPLTEEELELLVVGDYNDELIQSMI